MFNTTKDKVFAVVAAFVAAGIIVFGYFVVFVHVGNIN